MNLSGTNSNGNHTVSVVRPRPGRAGTGCPVLVNTSFNVRGEPICHSPEDAYHCFMRTEMDYLVLENYLLAKADQPAWAKDDRWKDEIELD